MTWVFILAKSTDKKGARIMRKVEGVMIFVSGLVGTRLAKAGLRLDKRNFQGLCYWKQGWG